MNHYSRSDALYGKIPWDYNEFKKACIFFDQLIETSRIKYYHMKGVDVAKLPPSPDDKLSTEETYVEFAWFLNELYPNDTLLQTAHTMRFHKINEFIDANIKLLADKDFFESPERNEALLTVLLKEPYFKDRPVIKDEDYFEIAGFNLLEVMEQAEALLKSRMI